MGMRMRVRMTMTILGTLAIRGVEELRGPYVLMRAQVGVVVRMMLYLLGYRGWLEGGCQPNV